MKRRIYLTKVPLEEAIRQFTQFLEENNLACPLPSEQIKAGESWNRVTAEAVYARLSSPHYHAAAMDGIAVYSGNTFGACESRPRQLQIGKEAFYIDTGGVLPSGCDAVIMIEDVQPVEENVVQIYAPARPWQHVRTIGEDIVSTEMILPANHRISPADVGALLAGGVTELKVHRRPRVCIIPTGSELIKPGSMPQPGQLIEFNSYMLGSYIRQWGGEWLPHPIVPDEPEQIKEAVRQALQNADVVIVNAGSSAGSRDWTVSIMEELGEVLLHGVSIRPGKPLVLGQAQGKPLIGIPGYPVSAVLDLELFVKPVVYRLQGLEPPRLPTLSARLCRRVLSPLGIDEFVRVNVGYVDGRYVAVPLPKGAGLITSLARADGLLRVDRHLQGIEAGEKVTIQLLRPVEEVRDRILAVGSHDLVMEILTDFLPRYAPGVQMASLHVGSMGGLLAIKRREAHVAGTHLLDAASGEYNLPFIDRILGGEDVVVVTLVERQQGLIVAPGNPLGLSGMADLAGGKVRFVNRQPGSGTRVLLDLGLQELGIDPADIKGYEREESSHMGVAAAVSTGTADAGLGIRAAARALRLDFIPVAWERYDLVMLRTTYELPAIQSLLEILHEPEFRRRVEELGGYKCSKTGEILRS